jgi:secreted trypsin-like serine protease
MCNVRESTPMLLVGLFLDPAPVIGGSNAPAGKWPDVAAVLYRQTDGTDEQMCTGVLIAPTVVLTAGHCDPALDPQIGDLDNVLLGTNSLAMGGETVPVASVHQYPSSQSSEDVTVLVLAQPAAETPVGIATGWARLDIQNGAGVELVGYGSIDMNGNTYIDELQNAQTTITDFDCSKSSGCNTAARPDGELGAGGMGIDTCPGDSGGPMYLLTSYGTWLAGITSRGYDNSQYACSEGGIYERPDKIVGWIEEVAGVPVTHGPEPTAEPPHTRSRSSRRRPTAPRRCAATAGCACVPIRRRAARTRSPSRSPTARARSRRRSRSRSWTARHPRAAMSTRSRSAMTAAAAVRARAAAPDRSRSRSACWHW